MTEEKANLWQLGHKRPWWCYNVLTLLGALFVLVWLRYLLNMHQASVIALTVLVIFAWLVMGFLGQAPRERPNQVSSKQPAYSLLATDSWRAPRVPPPPPWHVPLHVRNLHEVPAFATKDGSEIRELLAFRNSCIRWQSLAEARLPPGAATTPHYHPHTEEIYYILTGRGLMRLERSTEVVGPGDAIAIPPGARHQIANAGDTHLTFLCCCVPAYEHEDTVLVDDWPETPAEDPSPQSLN